jgi:hypothetical protein
VPERDLGADAGVFPGGRPYRIEFWVTEGTTLTTILFSTRGIEQHSAADLPERVRPLLEAADTDESWRRLAESGVKRLVGGAGTEMFSPTFVVRMPDW